jgi:hypothetical protein
VYQWKQEQDAKPKVKCPYCFKFFSQNINRWYYLFYVDMFWEYIFIICCQPNLKLTKSIGYLKSGLRHFETLTGDTICICVQFCNYKITLTRIFNEFWEYIFIICISRI